MSNILVVDDTPFWRDVVADALRLQHHSVQTATDGANALTVLDRNSTDLIVLDVDMPQMQGLKFLEKIRGNAKWQNLPVIMLTGDMQKDHVLLAKKLGAVDYLLKARFSPRELLDRIQKHTTAVKPPELSPASPSTQPRQHLLAVPPLMTQQACGERVRTALSGRTLAGVVAEVIALAGSPLIHLSKLAASVGRDAVLTAKVLQAASSAMNVGSRGPVRTLSEAVRVVGCMGVRNIAATIGIFEAMPAPGRDGFDPIRTWQHSIAVATLCDRLAPAELKSEAYLVGLCHNLGEILFRTHFADEYRQVLDMHRATGESLETLEIKMIGSSRGSISRQIIQLLGLPENISKPIDQFYHSARGMSSSSDRLNGILQIAESYATGCLLASSANSYVRAFTRNQCADYTGKTDPARPDDLKLRTDIFAMTKLYARLSAKESEASAQPLIPQCDARLLVVRDAGLSSFDPISAALESIAQATVIHSPPRPDQLKSYDALTIIARNPDVSGMTVADLASVVAVSNSPSLPVLLLYSRKTDQLQNTSMRLTTAHWPVSLADLQMFVQGIPRNTPAS